MKTSSLIASVLFGSLALAAPVNNKRAPVNNNNKRALVVKTEVYTETVIVWTTVYEGEVPQAAATTTPALFYEDKPKPQPTTTPTSIVAPVESTTPPVVAPTVVTPTAVPTTTSTSSTSSSFSSSTSIFTPPPPAAPTTTTEVKPEPTSTYVPPPPASTTADTPPAPAPTSGGGGEIHSGGSYTMNYYGGGVGACGKPISDTESVVALAVDVFGDATVDYMTGLTTNKWCGKKIEITNNGRTAIATIMDRCPGCVNGGLDATKALWDETTGGLGGASGDRIYSMTWRLLE